MKICDLDHLALMPPKAGSEELKLTGGIEIEAMTITLAFGESFALARTYSFTFAYAPLVFRPTIPTFNTNE